MFRSRRRRVTHLLLVMHRHLPLRTRPNHQALQALTRLAANRHRSLARHRPSTRRRLRSLPGMVWPNRGPTATTHRTRAISRLRRATPEVRATGRMHPPTISLPPIRPRPNPPPRMNRPGPTTASRTNQRTHRVTQPMPGRTSRRQRRRRLPWQAVCRWRRTPGVECTARPTARPTGRRARNPPRVRRNPRRRRRVHRRPHAPRRLPVPGQVRVTRRRRQSITALSHTPTAPVSPAAAQHLPRAVKRRAQGRTHPPRGTGTVREMAAPPSHPTPHETPSTPVAHQPDPPGSHPNPGAGTRPTSRRIPQAPWATRRMRAHMGSTS